MITLEPFDGGGIRHGFFTRQGGVSEGIFTSLNCSFGSGDDTTKVDSNRRIAVARLQSEAERLVTCYQVHSAEAVVVEVPWSRADAPKADAMVTRQKGVVLGILTADCVPVLFADKEAGVIGAAHAGWRGAVTGVLEATIAAMAGLGAAPERIVAGIGPAIAQSSYEVGPEFPAPFLELDPANSGFFAPSLRPGHYLFDLQGFVERRLRQAGVELVLRAPHDTAAEEDRFFSYRRACLRGEPDYGRGLSAIVLEGRS